MLNCMLASGQMHVCMFSSPTAHSTISVLLSIILTNYNVLSRKLQRKSLGLLKHYITFQWCKTCSAKCDTSCQWWPKRMINHKCPNYQFTANYRAEAANLFSAKDLPRKRQRIYQGHPHIPWNNLLCLIFLHFYKLSYMKKHMRKIFAISQERIPIKHNQHTEHIRNMVPISTVRKKISLGDNSILSFIVFQCNRIVMKSYIEISWYTFSCLNW